MSAVQVHRDRDVVVLVVDNPPVNAFRSDVRADLAAALDAACDDAAVKAVVIRGAGRMFSAGADITEFGRWPGSYSLPELINRVEACSKPVVAAIHGTALGGGLELALGCSHRLAARGARLGLPEVKLGLLPGAGGTQRLPRLIGVTPALRMIVFGEPVSAEKAYDLGLVDAVVDEAALETEAIACARRAAQAPRRTPLSVSATKVKGVDSAVFDRFLVENRRRFDRLEAPVACIEAVRGACELEPATAASKERELFFKLASGEQSKALRHVFFAERAAARVENQSAEVEPLPVRRVGVVGAGTMGAGIAMVFLSAGVPVTLVEREAAALGRGVSAIRRNFEGAAAKGRISPDVVESAMALLEPTLELEALADCDLVIEAVFELMEIKKTLFRELDQIVKPGAILASNTSYLDIDEMAAELSRPEQMVGLHFFSPANLMRLLEVVRGAHTSPAVLATCMALARRIGKIAVLSGVCWGFIGNRMLARRQAQAHALILEGARPSQVDQVLLDFGFPMGPFQMADLAGLDIGWDPTKSASATVREVLCERGRRGQKVGRGFYDYDAARNRSPSPEVEAIIDGFAARFGGPRRTVDDGEIRDRLLFPMINEAALILEEGVAQRPSDIDVVWLNGYGWPRWTGGPLFWADTIGLDKVVAGLQRSGALAQDQSVARSLRERAAASGRFHA